MYKIKWVWLNRHEVFEDFRGLVRRPMANQRIMMGLVMMCVLMMMMTMRRLYMDSMGVQGNGDSLTKDDLLLKPKSYLNESCVFHKPNPFDPTIMKFVNESYIPKCEPQYEIVTSLVNGTLNIREKEFVEFGDWSYRCLVTVAHAKFNVEKWINVINPNSTRPLCDVIEVQAEKYGNRTYGFVHQQIHKLNNIRLSSHEAPSVHIIVLDTVSSSNFVRSMKKTRAVMEKELGAIYFPYLNKVGHGSIVNSWSFLFGHQNENGTETIWGPAIQGKSPNKKKHMNPYYVGTPFKDKEYRTLLNEDDSASITCYAGCKGLENAADHWMVSFAKRINFDNPARPELYNYNETHSFRSHYAASCVETYTTMLNTLDQFMNIYKDEAQFSLTWMTKMAHDDLNVIYHTDEDFARFFEKNKEVLKNSFVFLIGDHGTRYGPVTDEPSAKYEDFNPTLMVSLPETLRNNGEFQKLLRRNTDELISHHDVYASLQDIAYSNGDLSNPSTEIYQSKVPQKLFGSSFFRPLPQPRNCFTLSIPQQYCLCQKVAKVEENSEMGIKIAEKAIQTINNDLIDNNYTEICVKHHLNKEAHVQLIEYDMPGINGEKYVLVLFMTHPARARYGAHAWIQNGNFEIKTNFFYRMNAYFWQSECMTIGIYRDYCYCKDKARLQGHEVD